MNLRKEGAEVFVPDGMAIVEALARTTHMGIGCHQDDLEIMAHHGILTCFGSGESWFLGVTVTNGSGSPRDDLYGDYSDEDMQVVRRAEQKKAAYVGELAKLLELRHGHRVLVRVLRHHVGVADEHLDGLDPLD